MTSKALIDVDAAGSRPGPEPVPIPAAAAAAPSADDMQAALVAFSSASRKVEEYYQRLELEVHRLTGDLKRKNSELRKKIVETEHMKAMLFSTLQSMTCGVVAVGRDGVVVAANPAACDLFGCDVDRLAGRSIESILKEIPGAEGLIAELESDDVGSTEVEWIVEANGHRRRAVQLSAVRAVPPHDRQLAGLILAEDVTELRRLEQQGQLHSRLSGMGELAMNLVHEIRNPLGSISLFATSLAHELTGDESLGPLSEHLVSGVRSLEHIVTNVLEFAQPRRLSMTQVDLDEVIRSSLTYIEHPRKQKEIKLNYAPETAGEGSDAERPLIAGDAEQLRQVVLNLTLNALQAMDEGGTLTVRLGAAGPGRWSVEVADDGVGIPAEELGRIFDPFFTTKVKGSGVGLAVVHRILTAHGAEIEVDSELDVGTTFRLTFRSQPFSDEV